MGFASYFKASKPVPTKHSTPNPAPEAHGHESSDDHELQPPSGQFGSGRPPSTSSRSLKSQASSVFLDDIKHEVMVNYLYQQQCSHLWVSDGTGEVEGVLLRKSRGQYMACPPNLGTSPFAFACAALNVQVRPPNAFRRPLADPPRSAP